MTEIRLVSGVIVVVIVAKMVSEVVSVRVRDRDVFSNKVYTTPESVAFHLVCGRYNLRMNRLRRIWTSSQKVRRLGV